MVFGNKKGSLDDMIFIVGALLGFAIMVLVFGKFIAEFNDNIQAGDIVPTDGKTAIQKVDDLTYTLDNGFLLLAVGLSVVAMVLAMLVVVHPIFFVFYLILLTLVIVVSGVASNIYQEAATNAVMASVASELVFTSHIMNYLPLFVGVVGFILAIVMYKTWEANQ